MHSGNAPLIDVMSLFSPLHLPLAHYPRFPLLPPLVLLLSSSSDIFKLPSPSLSSSFVLVSLFYSLINMFVCQLVVGEVKRSRGRTHVTC